MVSSVKSFFELLNTISIFECCDDLYVWYQTKAYMWANMKPKHTWKQNIQVYKSYALADPMYIFGQSGSLA